MTQVKRGAARAVSTRKQQRYSLMKIVGVLALICGFVVFLLQSDPFPGVRQAALRHRRQKDVNMESPGKMQRDFRSSEVIGDEASKASNSAKLSKGGVITGEIKEEKKKEDNENGGRIYTFELKNLKDGKTGNVVIQTKPEWAPLGVEHLHKLLDDDFYKDAKFFRVVNDFMVQFGIPAIPSKNQKTPIKDDPVIQTNSRGTITFATSGPNSRTTQIFITPEKQVTNI